MADKSLRDTEPGTVSVFWDLFLFFVMLPIVAASCYAYARNAGRATPPTELAAESGSWRSKGLERKDEFREWNDSKGNRVNAKFKGMNEGRVRLQKRDGKNVNRSIKQLSEEDQDFIRRKGSKE